METGDMVKYECILSSISITHMSHCKQQNPTCTTERTGELSAHGLQGGHNNQTPYK